MDTDKTLSDHLHAAIDRWLIQHPGAVRDDQQVIDIVLTIDILFAPKPLAIQIDATLDSSPGLDARGRQ